MNYPDPYKPDFRLIQAYNEATELDQKGMEGLCPAFTELAKTLTRYQDSILIGKGAVKEVYKTFNNHTKRWIAMARLRPDRGPDFYDLFLHEAWLTASLSHPNIITIHDTGIDEDGRPFFTMDLKGHSNLADRVTGPQAADRRELLEVFIKICDAVNYAHSRGIVHLDLKPENIQADVFGEVLVCDWGLAKVVGENEEGEDELPAALHPHDNVTLMGQIKGSPGFMAPEQAIPGSRKGIHSDIFALGCILHLILTGKPPFTGSPEEILDATRAGISVPPRSRYPECHIPEALEAVVMKAAARAPEDRYESAQALRNEIYNFLGGYSTLAEKPGFFREARLFLRRNWIPSAITFLAISALSIVSMLFIQGIQRQQERAAQFESEAQTATDLYLSELDRSEQERYELAIKLSNSASNLKKLGIFVRPVATVREARKLVSSALSLDSSCATAKLQRFSLDCITLNFKQALENAVNETSSLRDYMLFAQAFPDFDFLEENRPSIQQLQAFLEKSREINPNRQALMERIIAYDSAARTDYAGYVSVVEELLKYVNPQSKDLVLEFNPDNSTLIAYASHDVRFTIWDEWASNECLLRFLTFRSLKPVIADRFHLSDLQSLQIESLDLRDCDNLVINHPIDLPLLKTVYTRPGQIDQRTLRQSIRSNEYFEIVDAAPRTASE